MALGRSTGGSGREGRKTSTRRQPLPRRLRPVRLLAAAGLGAVLALGLGAAAYAVVMQPTVLKLPSLVRARLRANGGGAYVPYDRIPPFLVNALVATEDRSFWTNPGLSFEGIARAALVDLEHHALLEGGSTLQQQIARDMFLTPRKTFQRKFKGTVLAILMTRDFPRRELVALYLNEVYLGQGAYGLDRAAHTYFGVPPSRLDDAQCALLAGLPQAPSLYDPFTGYGDAKERQGAVLQSMVSAGYITARQAAALERAPLHLVRRPA